jgi:DNA adenine methylase
VRVKKYSDKHLALDLEGRRAHYYDVRDQSMCKASDADRGARLIFINKTCFNGLWRVNASGKLNVPFGRYTNPRILNAEVLRAASVALSGVDLRVADFDGAVADLSRGDFVYFDPPYVPVSKTANFTAYAADGFGPKEQQRLADLMSELGARGVRAMLSNASSSVTRELYGKFHVETLAVARHINSDATKRGNVDELVVMNYPASASSQPAHAASAVGSLAAS